MFANVRFSRVAIGPELTVKYEARLPKHNDNTSKVHPLKELATLLGGLLALFGLAYLILGLVIDFSVDRISPEMEQDWFKRSGLSFAIKSTLDTAELVDGERLSLFESLKQCSGIELDLNLWLIKSPVVNAIAIPGGEIALYSGLEEKLSTENGLAFVLAHELAHFQHRDHLRGMGRGIVLALLTSTVAGSDSSLTKLVSPLSVVGQTSYSRSRESDADALALDILNCHYGHVGGATEFFEAMLSSESDDWAFSHYFSTHPEVEDRIRAIDRLTENKGYQKQLPSKL